jgi:hypothetical protein
MFPRKAADSGLSTVDVRKESANTSGLRCAGLHISPGLEQTATFWMTPACAIKLRHPNRTSSLEVRPAPSRNVHGLIRSARRARFAGCSMDSARVRPSVHAVSTRGHPVRRVPGAPRPPDAGKGEFARTPWIAASTPRADSNHDRSANPITGVTHGPLAPFGHPSNGRRVVGLTGWSTPVRTLSAMVVRSCRGAFVTSLRWT